MYEQPRGMPAWNAKIAHALPHERRSFSDVDQVNPRAHMFLKPTTALPRSAGPLASPWTTAKPHNYCLEADLDVLRRKSTFSLATEPPRYEQNDVSSRFGRRLRELRKSGNLTQTDMARRFGIDRSYISDVERGKKSVSLPMLEVLALGFKVSLSDLFRDL